MLRSRAAFFFCLALILSFKGHVLLVAQEPSADQVMGLQGEYTDKADPDTPISFYVQQGKLVMESERHVPVELKPSSAVEFSIPGPKESKIRFTLDANGKATSVVFSRYRLRANRRAGASRLS